MNIKKIIVTIPILVVVFLVNIYLISMFVIRINALEERIELQSEKIEYYQMLSGSRESRIIYLEKELLYIYSKFGDSVGREIGGNR